MSVVVLSDPAPHVREIRLNRPEKLNALNGELRSALAGALRAVRADEDVRVVVLSGEGRAFCTGADVSAGSEYGAAAETRPEDERRRILASIDLFLDVWRLPVPVIAKIHGHCLGLATILANCCDIVLCADTATIGWPALPLGGGLLSPTWVWHVGMHRAKEMSYRIGSTITGAEAAAYGFANHAVSADQLDARTGSMAAEIARVSRDLLTLKKDALNQVHGRLGFEDAVRAGAAWDALAHTTRAATEVRAQRQQIGLKATIAAWQTQN
ncbi:enoyl-CoA hydratase/isomerase family protein [Amycolatopsis pithecellobii]|uniref:Enoyl-CoA hydratase/isomerase family protein n=1 Tax=Amycolatopsis pithecellobii TaxID=664692 RepID=A0A6N7YXV0_9PSEU|nr:enoyl-CoA hydratase-related protein [Amycolatopsis pithecellobii]MTD53179.1 enoyl-CoA hydratase/isomerase family protein [Amycolatopsis pithecellobii]